MERQLFQAARKARARAHAPYSGFRVGAAILADDGSIHVGCNVENVAYPEGICAETAAIAAMLAAGRRRIREILVVGSGRAVTTPCGGCRQRIREFAGDATVIHVCGPRGVAASFTVDELLPHAFGPDMSGRRR
ncbi:MAG: cytidine deaminase [Alphaproteobacteria bacterium]|nr:cytidine deaminase [Alphaproteobacteria bacterium]